MGSEWLQRYDADKAAWQAERAQLASDADERLRELGAAQERALAAAAEQHRGEVAAAKAHAAAEAKALERWVPLQLAHCQAATDGPCACMCAG